jgi:hypothetical protein
VNQVGTVFIAVVMACAAVEPAGATDVLMQSPAPYWEIGPRDTALSGACSTGRFNEQQQGRYTVQLHAKSGGAAVLGLAKANGLNLSDPDHRAHGVEDYYFRNDGTTNCQVFVGGRKPPVDPNAPAAGAAPPVPAAPVSPASP